MAGPSRGVKVDLLALIEFVKTLWHLLEPSDIDVVVDATVISLRGEAVASGFDEFDDLRAALRTWAADQLPTLVRRLEAGERVTPDDVSGSITVAVLDRFPDSRGERAAEAFLLALKRRLYGSSDGSFIIGQQVDASRVEIADGFESVNENIAARVEDLRKTVVTALATSDADAADGGPSALDPDRIRIEARLDDARQLLTSGKPATALQQLERIACNEAGHLWTRAQFRISLNSAVALMQIGDLAAAQDRLSRAASLYSDDPILRANLIQLHLLRDETEDALAIAREELEKGLRREVRAAVMHALIAAGHAIEALGVAPDTDSRGTGDLLALANAHMRLGNAEEAIGAADRAAALSPEDPATHHVCGIARLAAARSISHTADTTADSPVDAKGLVKAAKEELEKAAKLASQGELSSQLIDIRVNLAAAELAAGQFEATVALCDTVLDARPGDSVALLNRGAALFRLRQYERAAIDLTEALEEHPSESIIPLALSLAERGQFNQALRALQHVWNKEIDDDLRFDVADLALQIPEPGVYGPFVAEVESYLVERAAHTVAATVALARRAARFEDADEARRLLDSVDFEGSLGAGTSPLTVMDAGTIYYGLGEYASAARLTALIADIRQLPGAAELNVLSLYRGRQYREAFHAAAEYRTERGIRPTVAQIEASLLMQLGDMSSAAELYGEMYVADGDVRWLLNSASCWLADDDTQSARAAVDGIDLLSTELSPDGQMQAAGILLHLDVPIALDLAYSAARRAPNDPGIQSAYAGVFLQRSQAHEHAFDVSEVAPGTAVRVSIGEEQNWRLIVDRDEPSVHPLDVDPGSDLGVALLGHKSGDAIVIGSGDQSVVVRVEEIQSKYVRLFQEVFTDFGRRFPTDRSIRALSVSEGDFSELHAELGRQHQAMMDAMVMVNSKGVPAAAFSRLTGVGIFESTHALLTDSKVTSRMSDPSLLASDDIAADDTLVFDISALVTLQMLGLLPALMSTRVRCAVATQTLDELKAAEQRLQDRMKHDTLAGDGQHIALTKAEEHERQSVLDALAEIIRFAEERCESGVSTALLGHPSDGDSLRMMLGTPGLASVLYANDLGAVVVSDEAGTRVLSSVGLKARTTDTVGVIRMMVAAGATDEETARLSLGRLLDSGYTILPLSSGEVLEIVKERHLNPDANTVKVIRGALAKAALSPAEAAALGAEILRVACFDEPLGLAGRNLLDAVIEGLRERGGDCLAHALAATKRKLILAPLQWQRLAEYVRTWFGARGLQSPRLP